MVLSCDMPMPLIRAGISLEQLERFRMLDYITLLQNAANTGRTAHELTTVEVNQLKALIVEQYDRPANWISNLLCLYYDECRAPRTGGNTGGEKNLQGARNNLEEIVRNVIQLAPNPAQTWSTLTYRLIEEPINGKILVKDLFGRVVISKQMNGTQGQVVLDTRQLSKGVYLVECVSNEEMLRSDRLVVQ